MKKELVQRCVNYLMDSILYYVEDAPRVSDYVYDANCKYLAEHYGELSPEWQSVVELDALEAGTGYHIRYENLPEWVQPYIAPFI